MRKIKNKLVNKKSGINSLKDIDFLISRFQILLK